jgi:hypothetical protein
MKVEDFRGIALSFEGAVEGKHFDSPDFRVGGHIFATLAAQSQGYGNLMLTPEMQAELIAERPDLFLPAPGGWGRMGVTHIRLEKANEDLLAGVLHSAWKLRMEKNEKRPGKPAKTSAKKRTAK